MSARETILQRIRTPLTSADSFRAKFAAPSPPPAPEVWPRLSPDVETMVERFSNELRAVQGEPLRLGSVEEARQQLAVLMQEANLSHIGAVDSPAARELLGGLPSERVIWVEPSWSRQQIAQLPASLVIPEVLLADTGSSLVACGTVQERLLCYLPPVCIVFARLGQLVEHMPAAWQQVVSRAADPNLRGEFVIITGPSRTADIEKILILGVHGPKRLIVMLVE